MSSVSGFMFLTVYFTCWDLILILSREFVNTTRIRAINRLDAGLVKSYTSDLKSLLEEADIVESKAFLRSFVRRIDINRTQVVIHYNLPVPPSREQPQVLGVLPIDTLGGAGGIRTPYLLTASQTFSRLNYSPISALPAI